jgi:hypothetical protein
MDTEQIKSIEDLVHFAIGAMDEAVTNGEVSRITRNEYIDTIEGLCNVDVYNWSDYAIGYASALRDVLNILYGV